MEVYLVLEPLTPTLLLEVVVHGFTWLGQTQAISTSTLDGTHHLQQVATTIEVSQRGLKKYATLKARERCITWCAPAVAMACTVCLR